MSRGIAASFPTGWARPARYVAEYCNRLLPGKHAAVLDELLTPILAILISAPINKLLELLIGDLVLVHPIVFEMNRVQTEQLEVVVRHKDHLRRHAAFASQSELDLGALETGATLYSAKSCLHDFPAVVTKRQQKILDRSLTNRQPLAVGVVVRLDVNAGAGRNGVNRKRVGDLA